MDRHARLTRAALEEGMKRRYSAVLTAAEIEAYVPEPCMKFGSDEGVVQRLEIAGCTQRYAHGLEICRACECAER